MSACCSGGERASRGHRLGIWLKCLVDLPTKLLQALELIQQEAGGVLVPR